MSTATRPSSATGWYLFDSPSDAGTKLDLTIFPTGSYILGAAATQQFANLMASDGTVVGYKGTVESYYLRCPTGAETPVNGLIGHNGVNAKHTVIGTILSTYMGQPVPHAAIWKPDGTVVDLNSLLRRELRLILVRPARDQRQRRHRRARGPDLHPDAVGFLLPAGFVVDSILDDADKTPGDGNCATAAGACTLRAALQEVNAAKVASPTSIAFNLPGGNGTIKPDVAAPGREVPRGARRRGKVALLGTNAGAGASGLVLQGDESTRARDGHRGLRGLGRADRGVQRRRSARCPPTRRRARSPATRSRATARARSRSRAGRRT